MTQSITLLDGGLGQELILRSRRETPHPAWSLKVMQEEPSLVSDIHHDFCAAGARVIGTNSYVITRARLRNHATEDELEAYLDHAISLARTGIAASTSPYPTSVVASLPPLVASYVAAVAPDFEQAYQEYSELISLQKDKVDGFMLETMSNIAEATAGARALHEQNVVGVIGFTVDDDDGTKLRSGESLAEAVASVAEYRPDAILINCSRPEAVTAGLDIIKQTGIRFGAYANGFTAVEDLRPGGTVDSLSARTDLGPEAYAAHAMTWIAMGASIVGGCCEVGPEHIRVLHDQLLANGYELNHSLAA